MVLAVVALSLLAASCTFLETPVSEQITYLSAKEQQKLRVPMRSPKGPPRVLIFALDGVSRDQFQRVAASGRAPNIAKLLGRRIDAYTYEHAYVAPDALSTLPSTTVPSWTSIFSGQGPAYTGITGDEWFDRTTRRFFAPSPVSVHDYDDVLRQLNHGLIGQQMKVPTLFDLANVRTYVALGPIQKGADLYLVPDFDEVFPLIAGVTDGLVSRQSIQRKVDGRLDEEAGDTTTDAISDFGVADLQVVYFPGTDLYTHHAAFPLRDQRSYVEQVVDPVVKRVLDSYRRHSALDNTYVLFLSDHGHTPVLDDDRHSLDSKGKGEPPELLRDAGFRVRPPQLDVDARQRDFQAVLAYQGAMAYIYLADRSTCPHKGIVCDWSRPPRFQQDVMPLVRTLYQNNETGRWVPQMRGALDLILARKPVPPGQVTRPFEVYNGHQLVPIARYVLNHGREDLVDLNRRMSELAEGPYGERAGDIILLTKSGMNLPIEQRFYFSDPMRSWHGSAHEEDGSIIFALANGRRSGVQLRDLVGRTVDGRLTGLDITRVVLHLLSHGRQKPSMPGTHPTEEP